MVSHGMLFEVIDWIDAGKPTLRPVGRTSSAFVNAVLTPNFSMTQVLWGRAWQEHREASGAIGSLGIQNGSTVVFRYLLKNGCPVDDLTGSDLCETHDLGLVRLGISRGISILEPDGWASTFVRIGSRPLIRFYLEERDRIPGLRKDGVLALCKAIRKSKLRTIALLRWAGVDPLSKAPRYEDWDEPESEWSGFPALCLSSSEKPGEIIKLLKLKPDVKQWFELLGGMACGHPGNIAEIMELVSNPTDLIRRHPARSASLLTDTLHYIYWGYSRDPGRDEHRASLCMQLLEAGSRLRWHDVPSLNRFRRDFYKSGQKELILEILRRAAELGNEQDREVLVRLVDKPKMRELVIQYQPVILVLLGLEGAPSSVAVRRGAIGSHVGVERSGTNSESQGQSQPRMSALTTKSNRKVRSIPQPHEIKKPSGTVLTRKRVYTEIWNQAATYVAARYGISGSMLARICTKLQIPRPARGYWARSPSWRKNHILSLPAWTGKGRTYWVVNPVNVKAQRKR